MCWLETAVTETLTNSSRLMQAGRLSEAEGAAGAGNGGAGPGEAALWQQLAIVIQRLGRPTEAEVHAHRAGD